jgi:hypothetical protein
MPEKDLMYASNFVFFFLNNIVMSQKKYKIYFKKNLLFALACNRSDKGQT